MKKDEYLNFILNQSKQIIYDYDIFKDEIIWSGDIEGITGFDKDYFSNNKSSIWSNLVHPSDKLEFFSSFYGYEDNKENYEFRYRVRRKSGDYCFVEDKSKVFKNENSEIYRKIGVIRDINKREKVEQEIKDSKEYFQALIENSADAISIIDETGKNVYQSKSFEKMLGYKNEDRIGKSAFDFVHPDDKERLLKDLEEARKTPGSVTKLNVRMFDVNNNIHYIEGTGTNLLHSNIIKGFIINYHDATKSREDEAENIKLQKQLNHSSKMDAIGQLAEGIAHDFNNMLTGIIGAATLLKSKIEKTENKNLIDLILDTSIHASGLTASLLAFGRKENNISTNVDIHEIIDSTVNIFSKTMDKKVKLIITKNAKDYKVLGSLSILQNAIMNIGINASQAMPNGGDIIIETNNITLSDDYCEKSRFKLKSGKYIEIKISDNGIGISKKNIKKIFEPFFTTKELGKGTGLGLSAVYGAILKHDGEITVKSKLGASTSFRILFPLSIDKSKEGKKKAVDKDIISGTGNILLIDDENIIRFVGKKLLEKLGYNVIVAENGKEGLDIFKKSYKNIDLVLTDLTMPKMNGFEAFIKMKEVDKNCKVIISSGLIRDEDFIKFKKEGIADFINKPYNISNLSKVLKKNLLN